MAEKQFGSFFCALLMFVLCIMTLPVPASAGGGTNRALFQINIKNNLPPGSWVILHRIDYKTSWRGGALNVNYINTKGSKDMGDYRLKPGSQKFSAVIDWPGDSGYPVTFTLVYTRYTAGGKLPNGQPAVTASGELKMSYTINSGNDSFFQF